MESGQDGAGGGDEPSRMRALIGGLWRNGGGVSQSVQLVELSSSLHGDDKMRIDRGRPCGAICSISCNEQQAQARGGHVLTF